MQRSPKIKWLLLIHSVMSHTKKKTITRDVWHWYTVPFLTLTGIHSLAQTNELLSYISVRYHSVTWLHCSPFPISSFTDCHIAAIFSGAIAVNGQWRTYGPMHVCVYAQKHTDKDMCTPTHRPGVESDFFFFFFYSPDAINYLWVQTTESCFQPSKKPLHIQVTQRLQFHISSYFLLNLCCSTMPCVRYASAGILEAI